MTGRNEACPCGSGKKFKKCHGRPGTGAGAAPASAGSNLDIRQVLEKARELLNLKQSDAALDTLQQLPISPEVCALQVEVLVGRNETGDMDQALQIVERWQGLDNSRPEAWARALEIHINRQDARAAKAALGQLRAKSPGQSRTLYYQALYEQLFGEPERAWSLYLEAASSIQPSFSESAIAVMAAMRACSTGCGSHPGSNARNDRALLGQAYWVERLRSSLQAWSSEAGAAAEQRLIAAGWYQLGTTSMLGFEPAEFSVQCFEQSLKLNPMQPLAQANLLMALNYDAKSSPQEIFEAHRSAGRSIEQHTPPRSRKFLNSRTVNRPLRVAYLSSDLRRHPVAHFILPVLEQHESSKVRSHLYYTSEKPDDLTERARQSAHGFVHAWGFDDQSLARQMEQDQIDILVDLNGATANGRLNLLARRAAPVQITWLGYPNTTGLTQVDYRLVDGVTDPTPAADELCTEKLLRLPRLFSVYSPLDDLPAAVRNPRSDESAIVFGSFNNLSKFNDSLVQCWASLLQGVPGSRLLLKDFAFDMQATRQRMREWFGRNGLDPARLDFMGAVADKHDHMAVFGNIDIHLDTFPYNGTTTSCDSLVMGVPVITRAGDDHRSRVGASLLRSAGHPEWVASNQDDYIRLALNLANGQSFDGSHRSSLRDRVQASDLMDAVSFTAELEDAYRHCWETWCRPSGPIA